MLRHLHDFCREERGTFFTTEWVFVATILVLGAVSYLAARHEMLRGEVTAMRRMLD